MKTTATALFASCLVAAFAGCTDSPESTDIGIDFAGLLPAMNGTVEMGRYDAQPFYDNTTATHPAFYSAFDQLAGWSTASGIDIDVGPPSAYGFCLDRIAGIPEKAGCQAGATAYWSLSVNGNVAMMGMDSYELHAGDRVTWTLTPLRPSGGEAKGPLAVQLAPAAPTRNETVAVHGNVSHTALLSFSLVHGNETTAIPGQEADGAWSVTVPLAPGNSTFTVTADDGDGTATATTSLVRLAHGTMQVDFRGIPGHAARNDTVWFDPDSRPSASYYVGQPVAHPDYANVHDLMVAWTTETSVPVVYKPHATLGQQVMQIDGVGDPTTSSSAFWCYQVNGVSASFGITAQEFNDGDVVKWVLAPVC